VETELAGRVALVTGGARGLGAAIGAALAREGAAVVLADLDAKQAAAVAAEVRAAGGAATAVAGDLTVAADVERMVADACRSRGRLDILVNNAGIGERRRVRDLTEGEWDRMLAVNLKSAFLCARAALDRLAAPGGRIVNIASMWAQAPAAELAHYAAAKAGLLALTRTLAVECAPQGITVNAVAPGHIDTDMTRAMAPEALARARAAVLLPHGLGRPEDIADAVVFLASARARHITGVTLAVNGGQWID
jgi:3-oxoacyl-[acyl-carrier protein] reductase